LHRDSFVAKVPGPCPVLSSGNTTSPYYRAVISKPKHKLENDSNGKKSQSLTCHS